MRHWFFFLGDQFKTNLSVFKDAFFKRFSEDGCESDLDIVKQEGVGWQFHSLIPIGSLWFGLKWETLVSRAIKNLKPAIRGQVFILKPESMEELREAAKTVERGLMLTSSSSSVNLSETIQASVNAAITKMAQLMMTHTGDHATVASAPAQDQPRRYTPDQPPQRQTHQPRRYTPTTHPNGRHTNHTRVREMYEREYASDVVSHVFDVLFIGLRINIVTDVVNRDTLNLFVKNIWLIKP